MIFGASQLRVNGGVVSSSKLENAIRREQNAPSWWNVPRDPQTPMKECTFNHHGSPQPTQGSQ